MISPWIKGSPVIQTNEEEADPEATGKQSLRLAKHVSRGTWWQLATERLPQLILKSGPDHSVGQGKAPGSSQDVMATEKTDFSGMWLFLAKFAPYPYACCIFPS